MSTLGTTPSSRRRRTGMQQQLSLGLPLPLVLAFGFTSSALAQDSSGDGQSDGLINPSTSSGPTPSKSTQAIVIAVAVLVVVCTVVVAVFLRWRSKRRAARARNDPNQPLSMAQSSRNGGVVLQISAGARSTAQNRSRRPRRQPSVATVPEYSLEPKDEEMVLDKADDAVLETVELADTSSDTSSNHHPRELPSSRQSAQTVPRHGRQSSQFDPSLRLRDIDNPAPELRVDRYDTIDGAAHSDASMSRMQGEDGDGGHGGLLDYRRDRASAMSTASVNSTLEEVVVEQGGTPSLRSHSFFASPAYSNRSHSRSLDIYRTISTTDLATGNSSAMHSTADLQASGAIPNPPSRPRRASGLRSMFTRTSNGRTSNSVLPLHSNLPDSRREALRNREISAPLSETLVRSSYIYPKAGINPLQAAWLGARESISRITTYLDTAPPAFEEVQEDEESEGHAVHNEPPDSARSEETPALEASDSRINSAARPDIAQETPPSTTRRNVMSELEEESAQLSTLVHRASLRQHSLPPHMIALPQSLPGSPVSSMSPVDWPIPRRLSVRQHNGAPRGRLSSNPTSPSPASPRHRVHSDTSKGSEAMSSIPETSTTIDVPILKMPVPPKAPRAVSEGATQQAGTAPQDE